VYYNGEDLDYIARLHQITTAEVIQLHTVVTYRVFMTGFLPGFAYMGTVNEKIITPRKEKPRLQVAAGSVGIAGAQTGIYPFASPGGWQLVGTTPLRLFNKEKESPCLLKAGDRVQFVSITKKEFEQGNEH
jgi:inhibitor of KinA